MAYTLTPEASRVSVAGCALLRLSLAALALWRARTGFLPDVESVSQAGGGLGWLADPIWDGRPHRVWKQIREQVCERWNLTLSPRLWTPAGSRRPAPLVMLTRTKRIHGSQEENGRAWVFSSAEAAKEQPERQLDPPEQPR